MYLPDAFVRVSIHSDSFGVNSKLDPKYFKYSHLFEVYGPTLTLYKLDSDKILIANYVVVRPSSMSISNVLLCFVYGKHLVLY